MATLQQWLAALDKKRPRPARRANPYLEGNFAPIGHESDSPALAVIAGEVPASLRGTLYRMSPAPRFEPINSGLHHWFDGDGMIDAFFIDGGRVDHKNRWVKTQKLRIEEPAGRALFGGLRDMATSTALEGLFGIGLGVLDLLQLQVQALRGRPPSPAHLSRILAVVDRSNTSIVELAGHLLTLVEGAAAYEIEPGTLQTLGRFDFGGVIDPARGGMVAHPKREPGTGTIFTFGYRVDRGGLTYFVIGSDGKLRCQREFETPYPAMMHDFSVTQTKTVFYHLPAVMHINDLKNPNNVRWEPSRGASLAVVPREDPQAPLRWFSMPPCYIYHPLNAYDDRDTLVLDVVKHPRLPLFDLGGESMNPPLAEYPPGVLTRLRLDLQTGKLAETVLSDASCEFPTCDPRYATRPHRHGWVAARIGGTCGRGPYNALGHVDFQTGNVRFRTLGPSSYTNEALFVPRSPDSAEGDGYLLSTVYHADQGVSDLLILDALQLQAEPVAVVRTRERVPFGFHGTWVPAPS